MKNLKYMLQDDLHMCFYGKSKESVICSKEQGTEKGSLRTRIQHTTNIIKQLTDSCILVNQRNVGYLILEISLIEFL